MADWLTLPHALCSRLRCPFKELFDLIFPLKLDDPGFY